MPWYVYIIGPGSFISQLIYLVSMTNWSYEFLSFTSTSFQVVVTVYFIRLLLSKYYITQIPFVYIVSMLSSWIYLIVFILLMFIIILYSDLICLLITILRHVLLYVFCSSNKMFHFIYFQLLFYTAMYNSIIISNGFIISNDDHSLNSK